MKTICFVIAASVCSFLFFSLTAEEFPVLYKGRVRPFSAYAKLQEAREESLLWHRHFLNDSTNLREEEANLLREIAELRESGCAPKEIAVRLDSSHPLAHRLLKAGDDILALPSSFHAGTWYSLAALTCTAFDPVTGQLVPVQNFTSYPEEAFEKIRHHYESAGNYLRSGRFQEAEQEITALSALLQLSYGEIAGTSFVPAYGKTLRYPTLGQLAAEALYHRLPFIYAALSLYGAAFVFLLLGKNNNGWLMTGGLAVFLAACCLHTAILALRIYILARPPVSNMSETVIYVPWLASLISLTVYYWQRNVRILIASSLISCILLALLTALDPAFSMENVQAVLDSQFWLLIHVLMVVGSYGLFALSSILGHAYLLAYIRKGKESDQMKKTAAAVFHCMLIGLCLLIPGTILGGVWAAQSWGRFWDWDPKESWAFISSAFYLMCLHAFRFGHIANFGLCQGAVAGFLAISFTWYGVNYILGSGLHSYGFGSGGEVFYYLYLAGETLFLLYAGYILRKSNSRLATGL